MPVSYKEIDRLQDATDNLEDDAERVTEQIAALNIHSKHLSYSSAMTSIGGDHELLANTKKKDHGHKAHQTTTQLPGGNFLPPLLLSKAHSTNDQIP
jgi:hypothetical protein